MKRQNKAIVAAGVSVGILAAALGVVAILSPRALRLLWRGDVRELRPGARHERRTPSQRPRLLVLALDGVDRALLYELLRDGSLPRFAAILGGRQGTRFPHACLYDRLVTVLPSTTIAAWTTVFTGTPPGVHGITGNELFARDEGEMLAPAPVSFDDLSPTLAVYTDDMIGRRLDVPTVYEKLRERDPPIRIWVAMSQIYRGADRLLLAKASVLAEVFGAFLREELADATARGVYAELDEAVIEGVIEAVESDELPDVLTVYLAGTDLFTHHADVGPDEARRGYLREVLDPLLGRLGEALDRRGFFDDTYTVVLSDHGHTEVLHDERHALGTKGPDEPPELLRRLGYRVRPFAWKVDASDDYQAVLAYNGAMAFVYLANREGCKERGQRCDWSLPPRLREDVLPVADAFARASAEGAGFPALRGKLDMVLVRSEGADPYLVYTGGGNLEQVDTYLASHPHPSYVDVASRLRDMGSGPHGDHAGDIVLIAQNGNVDDPADRYYFASKYRSWHGSPSRQDSEVPLIVAHPRRSTDELSAVTTEVFGDEPRMHRVAELLLRLRS